MAQRGWRIFNLTWLWRLTKILDLLVVVFVDVLQQIKVNINVINRPNLDTVRNNDLNIHYASNLDLFSHFYLCFSLSHCTVRLHIEVTLIAPNVLARSTRTRMADKTFGG